MPTINGQEDVVPLPVSQDCIQCRHSIPALNGWADRVQYTTAHPIATQFPGHGYMDDLTTKLSFDLQASRAFDVLDYPFDMLSMGVCTLKDVRSTGAGIKCLYFMGKLLAVSHYWPSSNPGLGMWESEKVTSAIWLRRWLTGYNFRLTGKFKATVQTFNSCTSRPGVFHCLVVKTPMANTSENTSQAHHWPT